MRLLRLFFFASPYVRVPEYPRPPPSFIQSSIIINYTILICLLRVDIFRENQHLPPLRHFNMFTFDLMGNLDLRNFVKGAKMNKSKNCNTPSGFIDSHGTCNSSKSQILGRPSQRCTCTNHYSLAKVSGLSHCN